MRYYIRLDDACEKRDIKLWDRMEKLLDNYGVRPLVAVIPHVEDPKMEKYEYDELFWDRVGQWRDKGWSIAMHGFNHVYISKDGGLNPVNNKSEFAGVPIEIQKEKIEKGVLIFRWHKIEPMIFVAPSHTFDANTIIALKEKSNIRFISDSIAFKPYRSLGITFIPQQSGSVRKIPFGIVTFCYHPNTMTDEAFYRLEVFLKKNSRYFKEMELIETSRKLSLLDKIFRWLYFSFRKMRRVNR